MRECNYPGKPSFKSPLWISRLFTCFRGPFSCATGYISDFYADSVVCRTIYLHCQICWDLHVSRVPLIILNIVGWLVPAIFLVAAIAVAGITYTITDHCSIRQDWIVNLLILPIIIEIGISLVVQLATFVYCANVYLRSVREPPPPSGESLSNSEISGGSGRYPYRKAMARINKVRPLYRD
jgi:hypothetical protein